MWAEASPAQTRRMMVSNANRFMETSAASIQHDPAEVSSFLLSMVVVIPIVFLVIISIAVTVIVPVSIVIPVVVVINAAMVAIPIAIKVLSIVITGWIP